MEYNMDIDRGEGPDEGLRYDGLRTGLETIPPPPKKKSVRTRTKPSTERYGYWLEALWTRAPLKALLNGDEGGGKWLVFVDREHVDELWEEVRRKTVAGKLGIAAKVSTARKSKHSDPGGKHVICVYTKDHDDVRDVFEVRERLRDLGVEDPIPYKTNEMTRRGIYAGGNKPASKYFA